MKKDLRKRLKMIWYILTEKQVIVIAESHKHRTHKCNCKWAWDTKDDYNLDKIINKFRGEG